MNFDLTHEQRQICETLIAFAEREIKPHSAKWDREEFFPRAVVEKLGALGFLGVAFPQVYGGAGADTLSQVLVVEGISRYDASIGLSCAAHMSLGSGHIAMFGSEEQKARYLPDLISAKKLAAWCLTEPDSGSDAAALRTAAVRDGDHYVINGSKLFITNGNLAEVLVVMARTDPARGHDGISAFIVERGSPGLSNGRKIEKLGMRASDTAEVIFDNLSVPASNLIGEPGRGFRPQTISVLEGGRIGIAGFAAGIARGALEDSVAYARERKQFGKPIADFQAIQWMLADMATRIDAAWMLTCRAAQLRDSHRPFGREAAMAKLCASETAMWATIKAVQIHGGYGYMTDFPVERYMRDAKIAEIGEGSSEILRMIIAKSLLRDGATPA
ncbi:MAG TPA: acyl-CoA dehydrogenase family protein [Candidatus Binataceae bacterium]|nr:acyl-CoA dehydrogenase family protein [Candidatus Binataceae bacterium]